jgi:hypothetical protein
MSPLSCSIPADAAALLVEMQLADVLLRTQLGALFCTVLDIHISIRVQCECVTDLLPVFPSASAGHLRQSWLTACCNYVMSIAVVCTAA